MDSQRFDDLARLLASGESRRSVLRKVLGGAVAALAIRSRSGLAQGCGVAGDVCGPDLPDCCGAHECLSGTCEPFQPQCGFEGSACISTIDCCQGLCCDGTCHEQYACCPTDFTSPAPECGGNLTCDNNGTCVEIPCGQGGQSCGADGDCCDGVCCSGTCRSGVTCCYEDGYTSPHCAINEFCNDNGVCEFAPTCGEQGSGCALDQDCCQGVCCDGICEWSFQCCPSDPDPDPRCGDGQECAAGGICQPAPPCLEPGYICQDDGDCCEGSTCVPYEDVMICALPPCVGEGETCGGYVTCCGELYCAAESLTCVAETVPEGPTSKDQCKHGGWKTFTNPSFRNQGECISYVNHRD